jgi:hypothetical protein
MEDRRGVYRGLVGKPEEKNHLGDPGIDGRIILHGSSGIGCEGLDWIELAQDRDRCWALVNAVMNLWVP